MKKNVTSNQILGKNLKIIEHFFGQKKYKCNQKDCIFETNCKTTFWDHKKRKHQESNKEKAQLTKKPRTSKTENTNN